MLIKIYKIHIKNLEKWSNIRTKLFWICCRGWELSVPGNLALFLKQKWCNPLRVGAKNELTQSSVTTWQCIIFLKNAGWFPTQKHAFLNPPVSFADSFWSFWAPGVEEEEYPYGVLLLLLRRYSMYICIYIYHAPCPHAARFFRNFKKIRQNLLHFRLLFRFGKTANMC